MVHASLFTGIGGFDLAAEWCGWENSFQCEIDPFCQKVLAKNFPHATRYTDIKHFDARPYAGRVDVLSGGFPCQPASYAGKRGGNTDNRWLWPENLRIIDEVQPPWVVGENVAGLATLGLDGVLFDLEASGYEVETVLLPAASVGAPHRRDRLWIVAHSRRWAAERRRKLGELGVPATTATTTIWDAACGGCAATANTSGGCGSAVNQVCWRQPDTQRCPAAHPNGIGCRPGQPQRPKARDKANNSGTPAANPTSFGLGAWGTYAGRAQAHGNHALPNAAPSTWRLTEPPLCGPNDGLPAGLVRVSTRAKQLKAYGNSIVPQVAYEIFLAINALQAPPCSTP